MSASSNAIEYKFPLEGRDLSAVTEDEFICAAKTGLPIPIHGLPSGIQGRNIVRIASTAVMKICIPPLPQEALNMEYVSKHSDGRIRVPHVYRNFFSGGLGYLVMEFIDGRSLDTIPWTERTAQERQNIILQLSEALQIMDSLRGNQPGPVGQGIPMGGLFSDYGAGRIFESAADMEPWFNHKLGIFGHGDITGKLKDEDLVMCHMDLCPRNLILDKAGKLWILDWEWAGFFPRAFEIASLLDKRPFYPDYEFCQELLCELRYSRHDDSLMDLLLHVYNINHGSFAASHIIHGNQTST